MTINHEIKSPHTGYFGRSDCAGNLRFPSLCWEGLRLPAQPPSHTRWIWAGPTSEPNKTYLVSELSLKKR